MQDSKRDTDVKNRLLDSVGTPLDFSVGDGEGVMIWDNSIETCILPNVKELISPSSMQGTGHSKPAHWDNPKVWDREAGV